MSMGIHYFPWGLGICTTSCTTPSTTKGERPPQRNSWARPKGKGQTSHCLWLTPTMQCHFRLQNNSLSLQGTADRHFSHGTLQRAYKPRFVLGQNHRSSKAWQWLHKSKVTQVTASLYTSPKLHRELSAATVPLPTPGMLSHPLPCSLPQLRVTQLSSQEENHLCCSWTWTLSVHNDAHALLRNSKKERKRNPWGMVGQKWTGTHSHSYPALKWSYIHVGFQEKGCYRIFHCT